MLILDDMPDHAYNYLNNNLQVVIFMSVTKITEHIHALVCCVYHFAKTRSIDEFETKFSST